MTFIQKYATIIFGALAGAVNGLFGAGGGMVLVPMLSTKKDLEENQVFPASVCIMLPICLVSTIQKAFNGPLPIRDALPYMLGSVGGGLLAIYFGKKIPVLWLHRFLGLLILWGGIRYLC